MTGFIITGTDTDIGKSVFAAGLSAFLNARYWKPVQAGLEEGGDRQKVAELSGLPDAQILPEVYRLTTPCSPHQAAAIDGVDIDSAQLTLPEGEGVLIVEGAGGVLVPLSDEMLYVDMFARWGLPTILVASTGLGTINHTLMSLEALRARNVAIAGIAFIGDANAETERVIGAIGQAKHLGRLPLLDPLNAGTLLAAMEQGFSREDFQ